MAYLKVKVSPGARTEGLAGWQGDPSTGSGQAILRIRVTAPPERGKANEAVCRLLAARLGLPASAVTVARGATSRDKLLQVDGLTEAEVRRRLAAPMI